MIKRLLETGDEVIELRLCEAKQLALKPNQLYIFTIDPNCRECLDQAYHSLTGEPITRETL